MNIVSVLPITKHSPDNELSYYSSLNLNEGDIVKIPLGRRVILGIVRKITPAKEAKYSVRSANFELKKIIAKVGKSIFDKKVFESIETISKFYFLKAGDVAEIIMPRSVREEVEEKITPKQTERQIDDSAIFGTLESRVKFFKPIIREYLGNSKNIFIVAPTLFDVDVFAENFGKNIEQLVIKLTHHENKKRLLKNIKEIRSSKKSYLIIGTVSYLASIADKLSIIVLENENSSYYSNSIFGFDTRKFISTLANLLKIPIIYSDRYLSTDIWKEIRENKLKLKINDYRLNNETKITLLSCAEKKKRLEIISSEALKLLEEKINQKQKGFVLSQRHGFAPATICKDCGHFVVCPNCTRPLVIYHLNENKSFFKCNTCEIELSVNTVCSNCGGWQLYSLGVGTEKLYREITEIIKKSKVFVLSGAKIQKQTEKKKIIEDFNRISGVILISTLQFLIFNKKNIDYSFIPSFNSFATIPTFKITEKILDTISYLKNFSKEIIIEDYEDLSFILNDIIEEKIEKLQINELSLRQKLNLPPYSTLIKIKIKSKESEDLVEKTKKIMDYFGKWEPEKYRLAYRDKKTKNIIQNILFRIPKESWQIKNGVFENDPELKDELEKIPFEIEIDSNSLF